MNANNWSLDEMERLEFTVPYSAEQCAQRIESLSEPVSHRIRHKTQDYYRCRTLVVHVDSPEDVFVFRALRVNKYETRPSLARNIRSEAKVGLHGHANATQVTITYSRSVSVAQKYHAALLGCTALAAFIFAYVLLAAEGIDTAQLIWFVPLIAILFVISYKSLVRDFRRQTEILLTQIHKAFGVVYDPM